MFAAVQNERQPRNSATLRPEVLAEMDHERIIREAAAAVGAFGYFYSTVLLFSIPFTHDSYRPLMVTIVNTFPIAAEHSNQKWCNWNRWKIIYSLIIAVGTILNEIITEKRRNNDEKSLDSCSPLIGNDINSIKNDWIKPNENYWSINNCCY